MLEVDKQDCVRLSMEVLELGEGLGERLIALFGHERYQCPSFT